MGHCAPSGRGQHGRDGDRDGAGTPGEAATGRGDRTNGSASSLAGAARPEMRRRARSPSRQPPADHRPEAGVNRDASLFFCAPPASAPSGRHASADRANSPGNAGRPHGHFGVVPARHSRRNSTSARGRSCCKRPLRSGTSCTGTDGRTPARSAHRRRRGVDERHHWQDTRPAFVPVTVWGTASGQNCQVMVGAVLALNSGRVPAACRGARCLGYPTKTVSAADPQQGSNAAAPRCHRRRHPGVGAAPDRAGSQQTATIVRIVGLKSVGHFP
jgi:hypothetical protein